MFRASRAFCRWQVGRGVAQRRIGAASLPHGMLWQQTRLASSAPRWDWYRDGLRQQRLVHGLDSSPNGIRWLSTEQSKKENAEKSTDNEKKGAEDKVTEEEKKNGEKVEAKESTEKKSIDSEFEEVMKKVEKMFEDLGRTAGGSSGPSGGGKGPTGKGKAQPPPEERESNRKLLTLAAGALIVGFVISEMLSLPNTQEISWQEFTAELLAKGKVKKLRVETSEQRALVYVTGSQSPSFHMELGNDFGAFERRVERAELELDLDETPIEYHESPITRKDFIVNGLYFLALIGLLVYLFRGMMGSSGAAGIFGAGRSKAVEFKPDPNTRKLAYDDVAGLDEAKQEIREFVHFLSEPAQYKRLGAKMPKGALLVGPPGTGKTLLAKATAGEAKVPFFSTSGSDFIEMFVGVGPARVRDLFKQARAKAPCIIWIDEIDAIGKARSEGGYSGSNDERENTLNQLLVEMDGFQENAGVVVLAGTNRADILDKALLRPGRFDRQIAISNPDIQARKSIFQLHLKPLKLERACKEKQDELAQRLASLTPGMSGADIANICNEAALIAARYDKDYVGLSEFEAAIERVIGGLEKKNQVLAPEEKKTVAYHEAGHAVAAWFLEHATPLLKVSIVPRGSSALGYAMYLPRDQYLYTEDELNDMICVALGGRVAEELSFGAISSGAQDDLRKITKIAYSQIIEYGMNKRVGNLSYAQYNQGMVPRPYSNETAEAIDEEVQTAINNAYKRTKDILSEQLDGVKKVAELLLEKEVISHTDVENILGERQWKVEGDQAEDYYRSLQMGSWVSDLGNNNSKDSGSDAAKSDPSPQQK